MKYLMLMLMLLVSIAAYSAGPSKGSSAALPKDNQPTQLDDLMRGEKAAIQAYDQAIKDTKDAKEKATLEMIRKDHASAVTAMSKYTAGKPDVKEDVADAGAWGTFAEAWTKTRSLADNDGAVKALKQGEEHGIKEYEEALKDENFPKALKDQIRAELMPNQKKHIETLNTFM